MLKKPITYTNFNGEEVTRNFYFNLTKAEIAIRELSSDGTFTESMQAIKSSTKGSVVMPEFVKILKWTYGVKSADGEQFIKNDAVWVQFEQSEAYSVLIMELITDATGASKFISAVLPADLSARANELAANGFRPGAETLPQSRRDALNAEQAVPAQEAPLVDPNAATVPPAPVAQVTSDFGSVSTPRYPDGQ